MVKCSYCVIFAAIATKVEYRFHTIIKETQGIFTAVLQNRSPTFLHHLGFTVTCISSALLRVYQILASSRFEEPGSIERIDINVIATIMLFT